MEYRLSIINDPGMGGLRLYLTGEQSGSRYSAAPVDVVMELVKDPFVSLEPFMKFGYYESTNVLTAFSNGLIEAGFRDKVINHAPEINRLEKHLDDMRKIAFKKLGL